MGQGSWQLLFHRRYRYPLLLALLFLTLYILPLGVRPLTLPDETRYAEVPREMVATGDWVVPRLNGLRYFEKPALGYWIQALSLELFGENNFSVRLPSALAVGLSALLIFFLLYRTGWRAGSRGDGSDCHSGCDPGPAAVFFAPFIFLVCFEVYGVGVTAVLDNLFALFLTATIVFFYFASESTPGSGREKVLLVLSGIACGLAFLTKGFLAFVVPVLTLSAYLAWERRWRDLWRMSWLPLLAAIAVALPWCILIHLKEPDFWNFFFWNEHVRRFFGGDAQHKKMFFYYFLTAPGMIMPWTLVAPVAFIGIRNYFRDPQGRGRLVRLSLCWMILPFLFFSCAHGKILTYILPCFPPFAILMALGLLQGLKKAKAVAWFNRGSLVTAALFALVLLVLVVLQLFDINGLRPYGQPWKALLLINALVAAIIACGLAARVSKKTQKLVLMGLAPGLLLVSAHFAVPDVTLEKRSPGAFLAAYRSNLDPDTVVITEKRTVSAVCWYFGRDDVYILGRGGELEYGLAYKEAAGRRLDLLPAAEFIRRHPGKVILVARMEKFDRWRRHLPRPLSIINNGDQGYCIWRF